MKKIIVPLIPVALGLLLTLHAQNFERDPRRRGSGGLGGPSTHDPGPPSPDPGPPGPTSGTPARDPGVRGGPPGAGGKISGLSLGEGAYFDAGADDFSQEDSVLGTMPNTDRGLGPRFNLDSCGGCHAQPAVGGSSPAVNPQIAVANKHGAANTIPPFLTIDGPVREVRFKSGPGGGRDGGVHDLFTITGRSDANGCVLAQPDFSNTSNLSFRIPTPVFGGGLIESIPDAAILANQQANGGVKKALGISGHTNNNGNDGTITRFGWKAQNKSLLLFAGEAYNVEQGRTNELFPNERQPECSFNPVPEDATTFDAALGTDAVSDIVKFAIFMRFLAPPSPASDTPSSINGRALFGQVGCALCHTPTLTTGLSSTSALSNKPANLFSDLLVHNMGSRLADEVLQGNAGPDEFRSAPLWGLGKRIFFLHDGRTKDLLQAIAAHASTGSEANAVINNFNLLTEPQKQDVLNFLRGL